MPIGSEANNDVLSTTEGGIMTIRLNRPQALNSLTLSMIRRIRAALEHARSSDKVGMVLLRGTGNKAFCAGGDIKAIAAAVKENRMADAMTFFKEEYALDLCIHQFPKPVVAIANGITMGGGLGLCAGADVIITTETTRMAMPETRIGFFPDVGATGWLFQKCPNGYPEFLGLTGYEINGGETLRLGFSTHYMPSNNVAAAISALQIPTPTLALGEKNHLGQINAALSPFLSSDIPANPDMDDWVESYFSGKTSITGILSDLTQCTFENELCEGVFHRLSERSPTATVLTLKLLRYNQGKSMEKVFATETKAAEFILSHPDYLEGVRARLLDKDDDPHWDPQTFYEAEALNKDGCVASM